MQKQAPSVGRLLVAVGFALSCFGLLLFLWSTFGGPIPFAPQSYTFTADFPEATTLAQNADVRIGGVTVGKVTKLGLPKTGNATEATIELFPAYAPLSESARAILRQKTLLGETYVELTQGNRNGPQIPEGGHLKNTQVQNAVQIDEIFNALDERTRDNFRLWMKNSAIAIKGRGLDLNDALGNLGPFAHDANDVLAILNRQNRSVAKLVRSTGTVFGALSERQGELAGAITSSNTTFGALASRDQALAEVFHIFPTFEVETRLTLARLAKFATNTNSLVTDLKPVARDLTPTLRDVRILSPNLIDLFHNLNDLIDVSGTGLPALADFLAHLKPLLKQLDPFLQNLNPVVQYINAYKTNVTDFLANPPAGLADTLHAFPGQPAPRHALRQINYFSVESLSVFPTRLPTNRGDGYILPNGLIDRGAIRQNSFPSFDCKNTGATGGLGSGQVTYSPPSSPAPTEMNGPCVIPPNFPQAFGGGRAPQVFADR